MVSQCTLKEERVVTVGELFPGVPCTSPANFSVSFKGFRYQNIIKNHSYDVIL